MGREPWSLRDPDRFTARPTIRLAYPLIIGFFAAKIARHGTPARTSDPPQGGRTELPIEEKRQPTVSSKPAEILSPVGRTTTATD